MKERKKKQKRICATRIVLGILSQEIWVSSPWLLVSVFSYTIFLYTQTTPEIQVFRIQLKTAETLSMVQLTKSSPPPLIKETSLCKSWRPVKKSTANQKAGCGAQSWLAHPQHNQHLSLKNHQRRGGWRCPRTRGVGSLLWDRVS